MQYGSINQMANLSFLDAIGEMQRRSAISGRPAEKTAMDKLLRDNAIRRLSTRGVDAVNPDQDYTTDVYTGPMQREELGGDLASSENAPPTPNAVQTGLISEATGKGFEKGVANIMGFNIDEQGNPIPGLNTLASVVPAIKGFSLIEGLIKGGRAIKTALEPSKADVEFGLDTTPVTNPMTGLPQGFLSTGVPAEGVTVNPAPATPVNPGVLGTEAEAAQAEAGGASAGSPTVLCGELYRQGKLDWQTYLADSAYGQTLPPEVMEGYQIWAIPLSHRMHRSPLLSSIVEPFVRSWAYEMAYRMGKREHGTITGKIMSFFGEPICGLIGRSLKWHSTRPLQTL
jgi:hypothetical protein